MSRGVRLLIAIGAIIVLLAVGGGLYARWLLGGDAAGAPVELVIERGTTVTAVANQLVELDVVRSSLAFRLVARSRQLDSRLQAGVYELRTGMSVDAAIDVLLDEPRGPESFRFTVQEGLTVEQTLARIGAQLTGIEVEDLRAVLDERAAATANAPGLLQLPSWVPEPSSFGPDVREPFEGLLFPETYDVFAEATPLDVLQRMVDQLDRVMGRVPAEDLRAASDARLSRYAILVIASLIERETRVDEERPLVSAVIRNRIVAGMLLDIDATVLYALGRTDGAITQSDLEVDSPYNTRRRPGITPTPISGAGRASILAAFAPASVTYRYYVLDPVCDGSHVFADTLDEHNANVARFRAAGRCE